MAKSKTTSSRLEQSGCPDHILNAYKQVNEKLEKLNCNPLSIWVEETRFYNDYHEREFLHSVRTYKLLEGNDVTMYCYDAFLGDEAMESFFRGFSAALSTRNIR